MEEIYMRFNFKEAPLGIYASMDLSKVMDTYDIPGSVHGLKIKTYGGSSSNYSAFRIENGVPEKALHIIFDKEHQEELLDSMISGSPKHICWMYDKNPSRNLIVTKKDSEDEYLSELAHNITNPLVSIGAIFRSAIKRSDNRLDDYKIIVDQMFEIEKEIKLLYSSNVDYKEDIDKKEFASLFDKVDGFIQYLGDNLDDLRDSGDIPENHFDAISKEYGKLRKVIPKLREAESKYASLEKLL